MAIITWPHFGLLVSSFLLLVVISSVDGNSFEFLQQLEGSQKGNTVQGVQQLKQYLKRFGYLDASHSNDDEYDELVESAVKTYQLNYRLNVTGSLDPETLREMMKPRCGVPDIVNGTNTMSTGKKNERLLFRLYDGNLKWSKTHLTYRLHSQVEVVDRGTLLSVISRAFSRWAKVTRLTFAEAQYGSHADIEIGFYRQNHGDGESFDGRGGIVAHATPPQSGLFHYDAEENWSTNPTSSSQTDLESVAVHEIGHVLGLRHSSNSGAIMYASLYPGEIKRDLQRDDVQGIQTLYGLSR
ncbi:hypothetical protein ACHQM5_005854 [Ranunculus cassubicifolius]